MGTLAIALALSWWWIVAMARDMYGAMSGSSAWMMTSVWDPSHLFLLWSMWAVMMAAMMLPSAWPMLAMHAAFARRQAAGRGYVANLYLFAGGYVLVWAIFSAVATLLQRVLAGALVLTPMMEMASPTASATLLIVAGVYQMTPLKRVCLGSCRSPLGFLTRHWRRGRTGAALMGLEHGLHCLGCCWALMLLLFAGGVMNLYVIAALTLFVALEKMLPMGEQGGRISGALLMATAAWVLFK